MTTYAGLSVAVFRRLNRTADATVFDDCIGLTEAEINRRLALAPVRPMHTVATSVVSNEYHATPSDILDVDSLQLAYANDTFRVLATEPQNLASMAEITDTTGRPRFYAQVGVQFRFYPAPDAAYTQNLTYWAKVPGLTSVATTNWLSLSHPDVYFHGILAHAAQEYFDEKAADTNAQLFNLALQKVLDAYPRRPDKMPLRSEFLSLDSRRYGFDIRNG